MLETDVAVAGDVLDPSLDAAPLRTELRPFTPRTTRAAHLARRLLPPIFAALIIGLVVYFAVLGCT